VFVLDVMLDVALLAAALLLAIVSAYDSGDNQVQSQRSGFVRRNRRGRDRSRTCS
jgi:hypothetical protein